MRNTELASRSLSRWIGTSLLAGTSATFAQSDHEWVNQELLAKSIPQEQYVAIGTGDIAKCGAEAQTAVARVAVYQDCTATFALPSAYPSMECTRRNDAVKQFADQTLRNVYLGCMAKEGWIWTKVR